MTATTTRAARLAVWTQADKAWKLLAAERAGIKHSEPSVPYFVAIEQVMDTVLEREELR